MELSTIAESLKSAVCDAVTVTPTGRGRYVVHVPFTFPDGDHLVVLLKEQDGAFALSDEGHTYMHLSYEVPDYERGNRRAIIDKVLNSYGVEDRDGELLLPVQDDRYGDALFSYVQALMRVQDVSFLTRERVRSTFLEDFRELLGERATEHGYALDFDYAHPLHDPDHLYPIPARLDGSALPTGPVFLFPVSNDEQCSYATIALYRWEGWGERFRSIAVFRDQTQINRQVLARFSDVAGQQFSSLDTARQRLAPQLADLLGH